MTGGRGANGGSPRPVVDEVVVSGWWWWPERAGRGGRFLTGRPSNTPLLSPLSPPIPRHTSHCHTIAGEAWPTAPVRPVRPRGPRRAP